MSPKLSGGVRELSGGRRVRELSGGRRRYEKRSMSINLLFCILRRDLFLLNNLNVLKNHI